jgi:cytochrome c-type biogenesis protein
MPHIAVGQLLQGHPLAALGALFVAGLATSLTPCIYPMIPITIGVIGGAHGPPERRPGRRVVGLTLTYAAGLALLYAMLGLAAGLTGSLFGTVSSSWWARLLLGNLLLLFALAMLGVFPVATPARLLAWAGGLRGGSYPAVLLMGATSGLVAAPCGAPAFAAVLTWVAGTRSGALGFAYLFVFSLGMTAILIVAGLFSGTLSALPRAGRWMEWIQRGAGVVLVVMAEYYFVQAGQVW